MADPSHPEESLARALGVELSRALAGPAREATVTIEGRGIHWDCTSTHGPRSCRISCFVGPEYYAALEEGSRSVGTGRTSSLRDVISVAVFWLCGRPLQELYEEFEFVDRILRDLIGIQREVLREVPELAQAAAPKLEQEIGSPHLWFRSEKRSCEVLYYGKNDHPDFFFHWDSTEMFRLRTRDASVFAPLLRRWFVDSAVPSALKKDYPQIELHRVASYYEEGRPVEGEFICSWDWIERFYRVELAKNWKHSSRMVALLEEMRAAGFDKSLRAGQSLYTLMLSRSRRHGLRSEQPWVAIDIGQEGMKVTANLPKQEEVVSKGVVLTPALQRLLSQLESQPIS